MSGNSPQSDGTSLEKLRLSVQAHIHQHIESLDTDRSVDEAIEKAEKNRDMLFAAMDAASREELEIVLAALITALPYFSMSEKTGTLAFKEYIALVSEGTK